MPGQDQMQEEWMKQIREQLERKSEDEFQKKIIGDVWKPDSYIYEEKKRRLQRDIYREWAEQAKRVDDPVQRLRKEMQEQLDEIRDAIRKIGILLDGDAPTQEQMEKFKMLKEAYQKYKMIEALVLGQEAK